MKLLRNVGLLAVLFTAYYAAARDTVAYVDPKAPPGDSWFGNTWYRWDVAANEYDIPVGHPPYAEDAAQVYSNVSAGGSRVQIAGLSPMGIVISGGDFVVGHLTNNLDPVIPTTGSASFSGSTVEVQSDLTFSPLAGTLTFTSAYLLIDLGAYALVPPAPQGIVLSGASTIFNEGAFILSGTMASLTTDGTTGVTATFSNRPNAVLSSSGAVTVSGMAPDVLHIDNAGLIRCDGGVQTLGPGLVWTSSNTNGLSRFKTTGTDATNKFVGTVTVPAGLTFVFSGPGEGFFPKPVTVSGGLQAGVLDTASQLIDVGTLEIREGAAGPGTLHALAFEGFPSTVVWSGGRISLPTVTIDAGGIFKITNLSGEPTPDLGTNTMVDAYGDTIFAGTTAGTLSMASGSVFNNHAGGRFDSKDNGSITPDGGVTPIFNNAGTFRKSAGTGNTAFLDGIGVVGPIFNNSGLVDALTGRIVLLGGTNSGRFNVAAGAKVRFWNYTYTLAPGTTFTGSGVVELGGLSPILMLNTDVSMENFTFDLPGIMDGPHDLTVNSAFRWSNGTVQGTGAVNVASSAALAISGNVTLKQRALNNSGTAVWSGGYVSGGTGAVFNNRPPAFFDVLTGGAFSYNGVGAQPAFNNAGTVRNAAGFQPTINWPFTNSGTVLLQSNKMSFAGGFTQVAGGTEISPGAKLESFVRTAVPSVVILGGILGGSGSIQGFVTNSAGTVRPGSSLGILTVTDGYPTPYSQGPAGTLEIAIGGTALGTQYSQLAVSGAAVLDGTLKVNFTGGFLPSVGDTFAVVSFTSSSGRFAAVSGTDAGNGVVLVPRYTSTNVTLLAANEARISSPKLAGNQYSFNFNSTAGVGYVVEYTDSLVPPIQWQTLRTITGDGTLMSVVDPSATASQRFYRVRSQ